MWFARSHEIWQDSQSGALVPHEDDSQYVSAGALVPHEDDSQYVSVVLRVKRKRGTVEEGPPDALVLASKIIKLEEEDKDSNGVGNGTTVDLLVASFFIFVLVDSIFHWCGSYNGDKKEKEDDKPLLVSTCCNNNG